MRLSTLCTLAMECCSAPLRPIAQALAEDQAEMEGQGKLASLGSVIGCVVRAPEVGQAATTPRLDPEAQAIALEGLLRHLQVERPLR